MAIRKRITKIPILIILYLEVSVKRRFSDKDTVNNYLAVVKWLKIVGPYYGQIFITTYRYKGVCEEFLDHIIEGTYPFSDRVFVGVKYIRPEEVL